MSGYDWKTDIELKREVLLRAQSHAALHFFNGNVSPVEKVQLNAVY